jgi:hypothetical protein
MLSHFSLKDISLNEELKKSAQSVRTCLYILMVILLAGYIIVYQFSPFEALWNEIILNTVTALSAALAAGIATLIFLNHEKDDMPRIVWKNLMIACWLWFVGEVIWSYFYITRNEVPVGVADWSWLVGFIFFTLALYHQYSLIKPSKKNLYRNIAFGAWIVVLLLPLVNVYYTNTLDPRTYIDFYYPFADLALGIAGILLAFTFQGGALMRPWIGLVVFGITDFLYGWAIQVGIYAWSEENSNLLSLFIDTTYVAAYLILALGFLGYWILIQYGAHVRQTRD